MDALEPGNQVCRTTRENSGQPIDQEKVSSSLPHHLYPSPSHLPPKIPNGDQHHETVFQTTLRNRILIVLSDILAIFSATSNRADLFSSDEDFFPRRNRAEFPAALP